MDKFLLLDRCSGEVNILMCYIPASIQNLWSQNMGPGAISLSPINSHKKKNILMELAGRKRVKN